RSRHTTWPRDWSSDVCSSDLKVRMPTDPQQEKVTIVPMTPGGPANPVQLYAGSYPEVTEIEPNETPEQATKVPSIPATINGRIRSEEHTSELQSRGHLVCRLL